jgi:tetratricopeptide (TPR) repeat protein/ribonuclease BN (tRNA processing enzyme)
MSRKSSWKTLKEFIEKADEAFSYSPKKEESRSFYEEALKRAKKAKSKVDIGYIRGKIDLVDKKWEDALEHFDGVIALDADFFRAWCYKSCALRNLGRYEEALECSNKALKINPTYANAWYSKSCALRNLGRYEEALECSNKALKINPTYANALNNKGVLLRRIDKCEEAIECYNEALKINPDDIDALNNKGVLFSKMGRYEEALECYNKALKINSKYELARSNRNVTLRHLGKFDEAQEEEEKLSSEKKKEIRKLRISNEKKKERLLEIDAKNEVKNKLKDKYKEIFNTKEDYENKLAFSLRPRDNPLTENFFLVLRRWNSYTPAMLTATESNVGGGYFLHWNGKGIVIDPGFDFLDNFFSNELVIYDIDAVVITHAHVDHCSDFESLLTLLFEYNENNNKKKMIDVFMNLGAMKKLLGWIPIEEDKENALINRVYSLERGISYNLKDYNLRLTVTKAIHDEVLSKTYSVGLIFEMYGENKYTKDKPFRIGYTSDTKHDGDVEKQYKGVDVIIPHLGSVDTNDFNLEEEESFPKHEFVELAEMNDFDVEEEEQYEKDHLMLRGVISTIYKSHAKLAIISEFGEELGEHRTTIVGALDTVFQENGMARCLTGDIGLNVLIPDLRVKCHYCRDYVNTNEILEGIDPAHKDKKCVVYYCKDCRNVYEKIVPNLIQELLEQKQRHI